MKRQRVLVASFTALLLVSGGSSSTSAVASPTAAPSDSADTVGHVDGGAPRDNGTARGKGAERPPTSSESGYYAPSSAMPPEETIGILADSGVIYAGSCQYKQSAENVHISTSTGPRAASAHGYWKHWAGSCPSTADVDVTLQAAWCDNSGVCGWRTVATGNADVHAGGGRGNRATAREECRDTRSVAYRSYVDVDLNGVADPSGVTYSPQLDLYCYPSS